MINSDLKDFKGLSSLLYRQNPDTGLFERVQADLVFLKKGNDAKLDLHQETAPDWMVPDMPIAMNIVWPSKGIIVFTGQITYVLGNRIHIGDLEFCETIQRRHDLKVDFDAPGTLRTMDGLHDFPVEFANISASGAGFTLYAGEQHRPYIHKNKEYLLEFETEPGKTITLTVELLRMNSRLENGPFKCGVRFKNLRPGTEMSLRQLVFSCQKESNKKEREFKKIGLIEIDVFMK